MNTVMLSRSTCTKHLVTHTCRGGITMSLKEAAILTTRGLGLLILISFNLTSFAQSPGKVTAKVEFESGTLGFGEVTIKLYRVPQDCCKGCTKGSCTRKCCPIGSHLVDSITLRTSGKIEFADISPGTYFIENEADGMPAGYSKLIEVKENGKTDLTLPMDKGIPSWKNRMYQRSPRYKSTARKSQHARRVGRSEAEN